MNAANRGHQTTVKSDLRKRMSSDTNQRKARVQLSTKSWWRCLLLLLVLGGMNDRALGQEHTAINGTVVDATEAPIQGAQVEFRSPGGVTLTGSDQQGHFRVEGVEAGGTLVVSFPGFATVTRELRESRETHDQRSSRLHPLYSK